MTNINLTQRPLNDQVRIVEGKLRDMLYRLYQEGVDPRVLKAAMDNVSFDNIFHVNQQGEVVE